MAEGNGATPNANGTNGAGANGHGPTNRAGNRRENIEQFKDLLVNAMTMRSSWWRTLMDPRRDIDAECGYPSSEEGQGGGTISIDLYRTLYQREALATRVVQLMPKECWEAPPTVYEDEDDATQTPFEQAWDKLGQSLRGERSWFKDEVGSPVWDYLKRADILSGIGRFGVILLGLDDGMPLDTPVPGMMTLDPNEAEDEEDDDGEEAAQATKDMDGTVEGEDAEDASQDTDDVTGPATARPPRTGPNPVGNARARRPRRPYVINGVAWPTLRAYLQRSIPGDEVTVDRKGRPFKDDKVHVGSEAATRNAPDPDAPLPPNGQPYATQRRPNPVDPARPQPSQQPWDRPAPPQRTPGDLAAQPNQGPYAQFASFNPYSAYPSPDQRQMDAAAAPGGQTELPNYTQPSPWSQTSPWTEASGPPGDGTWKPEDGRGGLPPTKPGANMPFEASSYAGAQGTDAQYVGVQLSPTEYATRRPSKQKRKLLFVRCFGEDLIQIVQYEANVNNPRFGQPVMYRITLNDPREQHSGIGLPMATVRVHWSRVIHLADNRGSSEIFGVPRMEPVLNRLLDLRKLYSGSAEMYWRGAFPGYGLTTNPQMGPDVQVDFDSVRDTMEDYMNGLQRYMAFVGMSIMPLSPQVVDPTAQIQVQIEAICIQLGCPIRIFKGSERGELASSQDDQAWNDRKRERQNNYITPHVICRFTDRLIMVGVLPVPKTKPLPPPAVPPPPAPAAAPPGAPGAAPPGQPPGAAAPPSQPPAEGEGAPLEEAAQEAPPEDQGQAPAQPPPQGERPPFPPRKPPAQNRRVDGHGRIWRWVPLHPTLNAPCPPGGCPPGPNHNNPENLVGRMAAALARGSSGGGAKGKGKGKPFGGPPGDPHAAFGTDDADQEPQVDETGNPIPQEGGAEVWRHGPPGIQGKWVQVGLKAKLGYSVEWPLPDSLSAMDKATVGATRMQALGAFVSGQLESVMTPVKALTWGLGMDEEEARSTVEEARAAHAAQPGTPGAPMTMPSQGERGHPGTPEEPPQPPVIMGPDGMPQDGAPAEDGEGGDADFGLSRETDKAFGDKNPFGGAANVANANPQGCNQYSGPGCSTGGSATVTPGRRGAAAPPEQLRTEVGRGAQKSLEQSRLQKGETKPTAPQAAEEHGDHGHGDAPKRGGVLGAIQGAAAAAGHAAHVPIDFAKSIAQAGLEALPVKAQNAVAAIGNVVKKGMGYAFANFTIVEALAEQVHKDRGYTPEQARKFRETLSGIDMKTFEVLKVAAIAGMIPGSVAGSVISAVSPALGAAAGTAAGHAVGHGLHALGHAVHTPAVTAASVPVASAAYVAARFVQNPLKTLGSADALIEKHIMEPIHRWMATPGAGHESARQGRQRGGMGLEGLQHNQLAANADDAAEPSQEARDAADAVADAFDDVGWSGWFAALFAKALERGLDVEDALAAASRAFSQQPEGPTEPDADADAERALGHEAIAMGAAMRLSGRRRPAAPTANAPPSDGHWVTTEEGQHLYLGGDGALHTSPGGQQLTAGKPAAKLFAVPAPAGGGSKARPPGSPSKQVVFPPAQGAPGPAALAAGTPADAAEQSGGVPHPSKAQVIVKDVNEAFALKTAKSLLGEKADLQTVAHLVGAPDDAKVTVKADGAGSRLEVSVDHPRYTATRIMERDEQGKLFIHNDTFYAKGDTGGGLGTDVLSKQVANAQHLGVSYLKADAMGKPGGKMNGYYTWPRMGYDADLDNANSSDVFWKASKRFPGAETVQDVMKTAEGRQWWKENGGAVTDMKFDLSPGSHSQKVLAAYLEERAKRPPKGGSVANAAQQDTGDGGGHENIYLSQEEEAALERAWAALEGTRGEAAPSPQDTQGMSGAEQVALRAYTTIEPKLGPAARAGAKLAARVAEEHGLPEDVSEVIGRALAVADAVSRWTGNLPGLEGAKEALADLGGPVGYGAAKAGHFVPVAALIFLGRTLAGHDPDADVKKADPVEMVREARTRIQRVIEEDARHGGISSPPKEVNPPPGRPARDDAPPWEKARQAKQPQPPGNRRPQQMGGA